MFAKQSLNVIYCVCCTHCEWEKEKSQRKLVWLPRDRKRKRAPNCGLQVSKSVNVDIGKLSCIFQGFSALGSYGTNTYIFISRCVSIVNVLSASFHTLVLCSKTNKKPTPILYNVYIKIQKQKKIITIEIKISEIDFFSPIFC